MRRSKSSSDQLWVLYSWQASALIYDGIVKFFEFIMSHMYEACPTETCIWTWRFVGADINNSVGNQHGWVTHNCHQDKRLFCSSVEIFSCRGALQYAAVSCSVLQCVAVCYWVCSNKELGVFVSCDDLNAERHLTCCSVLQGVLPNMSRSVGQLRVCYCVVLQHRTRSISQLRCHECQTAFDVLQCVAGSVATHD